MQSVLSDDLEAKRRKIVKEHNKSVLVLFPIVAGIMFVLIEVIPMFTRGHDQFIWVFMGVMILGIYPLVGYAIYWITKRDDDLCRKLGFVCSHCGKPLYAPKGTSHFSGRCPKCGKGLTIQTMRQDERAKMSEMTPATGVNPLGLKKPFIIGSRIKFVKMITLAPTPDHPQILLADEGEVGTIMGIVSEECCWVKADATPKWFGAWSDEFEVTTPDPTSDPQTPQELR